MAQDFTWLKRRLEQENQMAEYAEKVKKYLRDNREDFMNKWSEACERTSGRISYDDMEIILGRNYPKASWIESDDRNQQIIAFFNEVRYPFRYDDTHLYFP